METSLKTGFAQIFSRCPKNLSCPKFGGGCSPPRPPGPYAYDHVVQKFENRKIYKLSNEVIFLAPFFVCFALFAFKLGATAKLCLYTRPEIKSWPDIKFCAHAHYVLPRCSSYQDGVEFGWRLALHSIPSESSLSYVCFGRKQETNCLRKAESFLYRLALSTNCYLAVLNVFFFFNVLSFVFPFQRGSGKKVWQSKCDDEKHQWNGESSVSQGENKGLCTFFNYLIM